MLSVLIVASRKHYTVDVLIAWYVVPLVFYTLSRRWTTKRHANDGALPADVVGYAGDIETGGALQVGVPPSERPPTMPSNPLHATVPVLGAQCRQHHSPCMELVCSWLLASG